MLINISFWGIVLLIPAILLVISAARSRNVESASIGGCMAGIGMAIIAFQYLYIFQHADETLEYRGSIATELTLGAVMMACLALIALSLVGWAQHRLFWTYFTRTGHA